MSFQLSTKVREQFPESYIDMVPQDKSRAGKGLILVPGSSISESKPIFQAISPTCSLMVFSKKLFLFRQESSLVGKSIISLKEIPNRLLVCNEKVYLIFSNYLRVYNLNGEYYSGCFLSKNLSFRCVCVARQALLLLFHDASNSEYKFVVSDLAKVARIKTVSIPIENFPLFTSGTEQLKIVRDHYFILGKYRNGADGLVDYCDSKGTAYFRDLSSTSDTFAVWKHIYLDDPGCLYAGLSSDSSLPSRA